jgi:D-aspartate ligase
MRTDNMDTPAVILSGNLGEDSNKRSMNDIALALTRSLGRHGVPVYRFHPDRSLTDLSSRYCIHVPCPNLYYDASGLVDALVRFAPAGSGSHRPVLFPASDGSAQFIADHEEELSAHFALTSPPAACINNIQNKRRLLEAARPAGIPVPETHFPKDTAEVHAIARRASYPVVIKPLYSPDWKRHEVTSVIGQVKALTVSEPKQLVNLCQTLLSLSSEFMVQEIVPGPDENLLTFLGYIGHNGNVLTGCVRKKLRQYPPRFGYCCSTESVHDKEVFDLAVELFKALNYCGIGCAEFKRDFRSGTVKLIEINTRAVRTSALAIAAGVDFPWVAYRDSVSPGSVKPVLAYTVPVRWIHLRDEIRAAALLMLKGQLSPVKWVRGFFGKSLVVAEFSWDDMVPGLELWAQVPARMMTNLFGRLRRLSKSKAINPHGIKE